MYCWYCLRSPTCQSLEIFVWRSCHRWNEKMINISKTVIMLIRMEIRNLAVEYWIFNQLKKSLISTFNNLVHTLHTINLINSIVINSLMIQNTQGILPSKRLGFRVFRKLTKSFFYNLIIQHGFTICLIQKYRVAKHE